MQVIFETLGCITCTKYKIALIKARSDHQAILPELISALTITVSNSVIANVRFLINITFQF